MAQEQILMVQLKGYSWKKILGADCVLSGENTASLTVSDLSTRIL